MSGQKHTVYKVTVKVPIDQRVPHCGSELIDYVVAAPTPQRAIDAVEQQTDAHAVIWQVWAPVDLDIKRPIVQRKTRTL